jgi:hypothetical protein
MKVRIKRMDGSEHHFDDVVNISIEAIEIVPLKEESKKNTTSKKQVYICNELGNWAIDVIRETEKAFLVNSGEKQIWLPKSKFAGNRIQEKDFNYFLNKT